ncbi:hypothetical protein F5883DRAFT_534370 [Diaporthe sp. PMI_573]|nr:hypothetical protein F5883DRAFT_534370 [Diaporthaceae sp. PMI_573]
MGYSRLPKFSKAFCLGLLHTGNIFQASHSQPLLALLPVIQPLGTHTRTTINTKKLPTAVIPHLYLPHLFLSNSWKSSMLSSIIKILVPNSLHQVILKIFAWQLDLHSLSLSFSGRRPSPRLLSGCAIEDAAIAKYSQAREATGILIFSLVVANIQMRLFADNRM